MKTFYTVLILLFVGITTNAQDQLVTSARLYYVEGDYEKAVSKLEEALATPSRLKARNIPKGYVTLAQTYYRIGVDTTLNKKYPNALFQSLEAYEAFKALSPDQDTKSTHSRLDKDLEREEFTERLGRAFYIDGASAYNEQQYPRALKYFKKSTELNPSDYNSHLMQGYTHLMVRDTVKAMQRIERAVELYTNQENKPGSPDTYMGSALVQLSLLKARNGEVREALDITEQGSKLFGDIPQISQDLERVRLSIYQSYPQLLDEARGEFERAILANPGDLQVILAYAGLLAQQPNKADQTRSLELYREVLKKEPSNLQANIGLGSYYINTAADLNSQMSSGNVSESRVAELEQEIIKNLKAAYPHMRAAHQAQPTELEWVIQLVNITSYVPEYQSEMSQWMQKQRALQQ